MAEDIYHAFVAALLKLLAAFVPAAFGALISQLLQRGITIRDRIIQFVVGILVSYYVTLGIVAWWALDPLVGQAISFVLGMSAYQATPKLIASITEACSRIPGLIVGRLGGRSDREG
jgi:hypothetical protein